MFAATTGQLQLGLLAAESDRKNDGDDSDGAMAAMATGKAPPATTAVTAVADWGGAATASGQQPPPLPAHQYKSYPQRHVVMALFCVSTALSAFIWISQAPVFSAVADAFAASSAMVNLLSETYYILYLPFSIVSTVLVERGGTKITLLVAAALNLAAVALKAGGALAVAGGSLPPAHGFALLLTGQFVAAAAQPLILNLAPRISADWYSDGGRDFATIFSTQANVLGQLLACIVPPAVVTDARSFAWLSLAQLAPALLVVVGVALWTTDAPPSPPSASAAAQWALRRRAAEEAKAATDGGSGGVWAAMSHETAKLGRQAGELARNRDFMLLTGGFSVGSACAWTLLTVQAQMLEPCGYTTLEVGYSSTALLGVGIATSLAAAPLMARARTYTNLQKGLMAYTLAATAALLAVTRPGISGAVIACWLAFGAGVQPLIPLSFEHAAEITFPTPADVSAAVLMAAANVLGLAATLGVTPLLGLPDSANCTTSATPAAGFLGGLMAAGLLLTLGIRRVSRRGGETGEGEGAPAAAADTEPLPPSPLHLAHGPAFDTTVSVSPLATAASISPAVAAAIATTTSGRGDRGAPPGSAPPTPSPHV